MNFLTMSFVAPPTDPEHSGGNPAQVYIVVPRSRAYLSDLLIKAFEGRDDVEIIVERRYSERRTQNRPVEMERRGAERRRHKEGLIEVVIGRIGDPETPRGSP